jgi:glycosyltransferase involved in cell wall biosynthesis
MAAGTPVITTRGGGIPEIVEDGISGILVERDSVDSLCDAMVDLIRDPDRRQAMGEAGRQRAEYFSWDRTVSSLVTVLSRALPGFATSPKIAAASAAS